MFATGYEHESFLEKETKLYQSREYLRYKINDTGIFPRRVPCASDALIRASSNEHTQEGQSIEEPENSNVMMAKRFKKLKSMKNEMAQSLIEYNFNAVQLEKILGVTQLEKGDSQ